MAAGQPTKYDPESLPALAGAAAAEGKTNKEIAAALGISVGTLWNWEKEYPEFLSAIKEGKSLADDEVEKSLYKRATGEYVEETKTSVFADGSVKKETVEKYIADTTAMIYWLNNRRPDKWRNRSQQEISGPDGGPIEITRMPDDELELRAKQILSRRAGNTN